VCLTTLLGLAPLRPGQPVSAAAQELGAKIWVGRYQEIEEYLRTAECVSMQNLGSGSGVMRCTLRPGGLVARMAWRSGPPGIYRGFWESYKAEIAAYELDKLLKMNMLPPAVEREFQGNKGSGVQWVENTVDSKTASPDESNRAGWEKQLVQMKMFDNLIGNPVRNTGNMLRDAAWNLILLDHSRAFRPGADLPHRLSLIDADFWGKVQGLTRKQLDARLGPWLDENQITAILDRRERMKADIDRLVAERGAGAVFLR
jgi:hypothetical protein